MNVDDFAKAYDILEKHGFKNTRGLCDMACMERNAGKQLWIPVFHADAMLHIFQHLKIVKAVTIGESLRIFPQGKQPPHFPFRSNVSLHVQGGQYILYQDLLSQQLAMKKNARPAHIIQKTEPAPVLSSEVFYVTKAYF